MNLKTFITKFKIETGFDLNQIYKDPEKTIRRRLNEKRIAGTLKTVNGKDIWEISESGYRKAVKNKNALFNLTATISSQHSKRQTSNAFTKDQRDEVLRIVKEQISKTKLV